MTLSGIGTEVDFSGSESDLSSQKIRAAWMAIVVPAPEASGGRKGPFRASIRGTTSNPGFEFI